MIPGKVIYLENMPEVNANRKIDRGKTEGVTLMSDNKFTRVIVIGYGLSRVKCYVM